MKNKLLSVVFSLPFLVSHAYAADSVPTGSNNDELTDSSVEEVRELVKQIEIGEHINFIYRIFDEVVLKNLKNDNPDTELFDNAKAFVFMAIDNVLKDTFETEEEKAAVAYGLHAAGGIAVTKMAESKGTKDEAVVNSKFSPIANAIIETPQVSSFILKYSV